MVVIKQAPAFASFWHVALTLNLCIWQNKQEELLAVGFASRQGIRVPPGNAHYSFTAFEALTRSNYHRPCQFTYAPSSVSLQVPSALLIEIRACPYPCRQSRSFCLKIILRDCPRIHEHQESERLLRGGDIWWQR